jgi:DNA transposition AAA+ family ATPase
MSATNEKITDPDNDPEIWSGTNLAGDIVAQGIKKSKPEFQEDLRWAYQFALQNGWSQIDMAREWGISSSAVSRVFSGKYTNSEGLVLAPPAIMISRIREQRKIQVELLHRRTDRVKTITVEKIWKFAHKISGRAANGKTVPGQKRLMGFLYGESHLGKSEALQWYREEFNHGRTIYIDLQDCNGVQEIYREFARALGLSADTAATKLKQRIIKAIDSDTLIICDELHHVTYAYRKNSSKLMINALKSIKDRTRCAMLLCGTYVAQEEIDDGNEAKLLIQLKRRAAFRELHLPDGIPVYDVRLISENRGLPFPKPPTRSRNRNGVNLDTWERLRKDHEGTELEDIVKMLDEIAFNHGIEALFTNIEDGKLIAKSQGRDLTWQDVYDAYKTNQCMKIKEAI